MFSNQRNSLVAVCAYVLFSLSGLSHASTMTVGEPVALSDLIDGNVASVVVGDKIFDGFDYTPIGDMPAAEDILVRGVVDCDGNYGIRFQGGFVDLPGGGVSDAVVVFSVSVAAGSGMEITGAVLDSNINAVGTGYAEIVETFEPFDNDSIVNFDGAFGSQLLDSVDFAGTTDTLVVTKDILLAAGDEGAASLSVMDQFFVQVVVPEPASAMLLLFGLIGLAVGRRK